MDSGSSSNLAAPAASTNAQPGKTEEVQDARKNFNYALTKFCDMADEMRAETMDLVVAAVEKHTGNFEAASKSVKESMDKRFGAFWHVVIGEGFAFDITYEMRHLLYLYFSGSIGIVVWKAS
jgi:dynein light chain 4